MEHSVHKVDGRAESRGERGRGQQQWLARRSAGLVGGSFRHALAEDMAANGGKIADLVGELHTLELGARDRGDMRFWPASVTKPIGSATSVRDRGNRVVLGSDGSYVELKSSGERIPSRRLDGAYVSDVWVGGGQPRPDKTFRRQEWRP